MTASPRRRAPAAVGVLLAGGLAACTALQGGWLHAAAALPLLALAAFAVWRAPVRRSRWLLAGAVVLAGVALAPWLVAPTVPRLPPPTGRYAVGVHVFRWTDAARAEPATADPADRRGVVAELWYPAERRGGARPDYIDGQGSLPPSVSGMPRLLLRNAALIDTHAVLDAPAAEAGRRWPLILFSPGAEAPRAFYTGLCVELASRGFALAALDHPYDSPVVRLAAGRLVTDARLFARTVRSPAEGAAFMAASQAQRAADLRFALDQLGREPLGARLELSRVTAAGHSFGGASALEFGLGDPRVVAVINLDGTIYGDPGAGRNRPRLLVVESDEALTRHGDAYRAGMARLAAALGGPIPVERITGASHVSFTDAPAFVAWPVRAVLPRLFGRRGSAEVQRAAADRIAALARAAGAAP